jgi:membrane protein DedA with SNARE-associated domain
MERFMASMASLPEGLLYLALALTAAVENIFPPLPSDTVVAFGAFLAARGQGTAVGAFLSVWIGNVAGAMLMYWVGRRFGTEKLRNRLVGGSGPEMEQRLERLYGKHGIAALFVSRFLPGVRALVPPFAGAVRIPWPQATFAIAGASAIWYGTITYVAFSVGSNMEEVMETVGSWQRLIGIVAIVLVLMVAVALLIRRRRARS